MRVEPLLPQSQEADDQNVGRGRQINIGRLRGGANEFTDAVTCVFGCLAVVVVVFSVFLNFFFTPLEPNEYGLERNTLTNSIGDMVYRGGLRPTGPMKNFIIFPASQLTLEFSKHSVDRAPVLTRTGADPADPDSGGQPISVSGAVQYRFVQDKIRDVYLKIGAYEATKQRLLLLAGNMISNTAQEFTPQDFWTSRDIIAARMFEQINQTLWDEAYVVATGIELMKVDFAESFENSITQVQVAEQQQEINKYDQQVQQVTQSIEVLQSENEAHIANILASAVADAKEIQGNASRDAFNYKQAEKARMYAKLQSALGFTKKQMSEYFKVKALQSQEENGRVVVGVPAIDEAALLPPRHVS